MYAMKIKIFNLILTVTAVFTYGAVYAQHTRILSKAEVKVLERDETSGPYPAFRVYEYSDHGGYYNLLLCEHKLPNKGKDTLINEITALCVSEDHGGYLEHWNIKDQLDLNLDETSIWFWTKYASATDLDGDKLIDPVIVYGTKDSDDEYRRVKIITVYKGKKIVIRAVESTLDYGRSFKKDKQFNTLPAKIKTHLEKLLNKIRDEQGVLLKDG
jgi:hypothetical protein